MPLASFLVSSGFTWSAGAKDEPPKPGLVALSAGIAAARFAVDTGSSPPCCGERAYWEGVDGSFALVGDFGPLGLHTYSTGGAFVRFVP